MAEYQKEKAEVEDFLDNVKLLITNNGNVQINCMPWKGNRVLIRHYHIWQKQELLKQIWRK